jgi:hypothetical protein
MDKEALCKMIDLERREWTTTLSAIARERDEIQDELLYQARAKAKASAPVRHNFDFRAPRRDALQKMLRARLDLREEYAKNEPDLLADECLADLRDELEHFIKQEGQRRPRRQCRSPRLCVRTNRQFSETVDAPREKLIAVAKEMGFEGIIASPSGRTPATRSANATAPGSS